MARLLGFVLLALALASCRTTGSAGAAGGNASAGAGGILSTVIGF